MKRVMRINLRDVVCGCAFFVAAAGSQNSVLARDFSAVSPLQAIEIYTFVLPAIDCYRTTGVKFTTDQKALGDLLERWPDKTSDKQSDRLKDAAVRGAAQYDKMVAKVGRQKFCETVVRRYGPKGTVLRGLVIEKRSS
jgi:hypothetical protein